MGRANQFDVPSSFAQQALVTHQKSRARRTNFASGFNADSAVQSSLEKYTSSVFRENMIVWRHPASMQRAYRDRHDT
jgi:hypothetical protein